MGLVREYSMKPDQLSTIRTVAETQNNNLMSLKYMKRTTSLSVPYAYYMIIGTCSQLLTVRAVAKTCNRKVVSPKYL